jgi:hypothetical protein
MTPDRVYPSDFVSAGTAWNIIGCFSAHSARARSRRTYFCTLPVCVRGSRPKTTVFGGHDVGLGSGGAVLQLDEGARRLAPLHVGTRDHGGFEHVGMLVKDVLNLDRGDVLAAGDDDVLGAAM